ncbi:DNA glycosylase AlkZ-like family protein [Baekduia soli]|uniref:DNA glycosylase AlkZ-like family protein n=1 Tax=Baekduia soli TaxID=496014 RepID=UPI001E3B66BD|nr:crosslink repair DNA glycosylase YcaQ family protein [Baekduia soli]
MRHHLAPGARAPHAEDVAAGVVAIHSTDPSSVVVGTWARLADRTATAAELERALYEERTLLRLLAMRRTMFVVDRAVAPIVHAACSLTVAARERAKLLKLLEEAGIGGRRRAAWLAKAEAALLEALASGDELTAVQLADADARLGTEIVLAPGRAYEARVRVASRVLTVLAAEGRVVRTRPRGGWASTQFRWAALPAWAGAPLEELEPARADAALALRWLCAYGPASPEDLQWWTGWPAARTRRALDQDAVTACTLEDGAPGVVAADDLDDVDADPWVALLPALDATPMGWKRRGFYLGEHAERVFDANGNVGPTVWCDGRIVGGWARPPGSGELAFTLLEDVGAEARAAIAAEAAALAPRLGDARLAPRARGYSPVERELLGR